MAQVGLMLSFSWTDSGFWLALLAGLFASACFIWWLITGARKSR
jgi:hypothetical protein